MDYDGLGFLKILRSNANNVNALTVNAKFNYYNPQFTPNNRSYNAELKLNDTPFL